jgi:hypothetical protein
MAEKISLKKGPAGTAHRRVSVVGVWQKLEVLKALAAEAESQGVPGFPEKICEWAEDFWGELGKCSDTYITYR